MPLGLVIEKTHWVIVTMSPEQMGNGFHPYESGRELALETTKVYKTEKFFAYRYLDGPEPCPTFY